MEETGPSFQIVRVSFYQGGGEAGEGKTDGRTLVSIVSDGSDISILVCLTETYCYWHWLMHGRLFHQHKLDIYISQNSQLLL